MPIGQQRYAEVAGVAGTPANVAGVGFGAGAGAQVINHLVETVPTVMGPTGSAIGRFSYPGVGQLYLVERLMVVAPTSSVTDTAVLVAVADPGEPLYSPAIGRDAANLAIVGDLSLVVFEFVNPLLVPGGQALMVITSDVGLLCTAQIVAMG